MEKVVIINGLGGSGKSQFCQDCIEYCKGIRGVKAYEFSTIDYIKSVARMVGWNGKKTEKDRVFLHDLKVAFEKWNNYPNIDCLNKIKELGSKPKTLNICFVNIREAYNITRFKKMCEAEGYEVMLLKVMRPDGDIDEAPEVIEEIDKIEYDMIVLNSRGLEELKASAIDFVERLRN